MRIKNIGSGPVTTHIRSAYYLKGPSTGEVWKLIANDGTESSLLPPGAEVIETITQATRLPKRESTTSKPVLITKRVSLRRMRGITAW